MRWPYIISLIALLGAGLLLFFNILCGASNSSVLGQFYWLEAQTSGITGAHDTTRWTNYNSCGVQNGRNYDCSKSQAAYPMSPRSNFGSSSGIPSKFSSRRGITYYLSRVGWAFLLLGLLFTLLALLPVAFSFCLPSLSILGIGSGFATSAALLFTTLAAALLTAAYVKARNNFRDDGRSTSLGKKMFGFIWASVALLFLSSLFSGVGCIGSMFGKRKEKKRSYSENYDTSSHETYGNNYVHEKREEPTRGGFFNKKKNNEEAELENIGYHAGLGASGATSNITGGGAAGTQRGVNSFDHDPEKLDDVGYHAGLGSSGATSDVAQPEQAHTKDSGSGSGLGTAAGVGAAGLAGAAALGHHNKSKKNDTIPEANEGDYYGDNQYGSSSYPQGGDSTTGAYGSTSGKNRDLTGNSTGIQSTNPETGETLDDVGYAAGLGASGATSNATGAPVATSSKNTRGDGYNNQTSGSNAAYSDSSKPYDTGAATGYDNKKSSSNQGVIGAAAAALGLGGAAAASHHNKDDTTPGTKSGNPYGSNTSEQDYYHPDSTSSDPYGNTSSTRDTSGNYGNYSNDPSYSGDKSHGYGTTAAGAGAGAAAGYALGKGSNKPAGGHASRGPAYDYDPEGTDVGLGATRAGANSAKDRAYKNQYENKSTALPVGASHYNQDSYGNQSSGYDTGVPNDGAAAAATAASAGAVGAGAGVVGSGSGTTGYSADPNSTTGNHYRAVNQGAAVRPEDTYKNLYANSRDTSDVTDTSGYKPTNYYARKTGQEFDTNKDAEVSGTGAGDNVYGSTKDTDRYGSTDQDATRSGTTEDSTASNAAKGGFFGSILGFGGSKKSTDNSELAKRNSTSSSVYDSQSDVGATGNTTRDTGAYGSSSSKAGRQGDRDAVYNQGTSSTGQTGYGDEQTTGTNSGKKSSGINKETIGVAGAAAGAAGAYGASKTGHDKEFGKAKDVGRDTYDKHGDKIDEYVGGKGKSSSKDATTGTNATKSSSRDPTSSAYGASSGSKSTQPTSSTGETLDDVGYSAGYGASGATADTSKLDKSSGSRGTTTGTQDNSAKDSTTKTSSGSGKKSSGIDKEKLGVAGAAAGAAGAYGASKTGHDKEFGKAKDVGRDTYDKHGDKINDYIGGKGKSSSNNATTGATKSFSRDPTSSSAVGASTGSKSTSQTTGPNGETLDDVAYSAGYGASGATADTSKYDRSNNSHGITGAQRESKSATTGKDSSKSSKDDYGSSAAKTLGVGTAAAATGTAATKGSSNSKYSSKPGNSEDIYTGSNTKSSSYGSNDKYSSSKGYNTSTADAAVDPSRNRNPIAEGLTGTSSSKPTSADPSSTTGSYGTSKQGSNVAGISNDDRTQNYGSTKSGAYTSGPSTGEKLESSLSGQERSSKTRANEISSSKAGKGALGAGALGAGAGATLGGNKSSNDNYATSGYNTSSSNKYKTTGADSSRRYGGETYDEDDIPGTFPSNNVSSPTQKTSTLDSNYTTSQRGTSGAYGSNVEGSNYGSDSYGNTNTTRRSGNEVQYDANGNPIQEETLLQKVVETAKSVI